MSASLGRVRKYSLVPYLDRCPEYHGTYKVFCRDSPSARVKLIRLARATDYIIHVNSADEAL